MKRVEEIKTPFIIILLSLIIGIIVGIKIDLSLSILLIILVILAVSIIILWYYEVNLTKVLILVFILLIGVTQVQILQYQYHAPSSITNYVEKEVYIKGIITSAQASTEGQEYIIKPWKIIKEQSSVKINYGQVLIKKKEANQEYNYGDVIRIRGRLSLPPDNRNPGFFSYRDYLKRKEIYAWLETSNINQIKLLDNRGNRVIKLALQIKSKAENIIDKTMQEPYNFLLRGFLLGESDLIPEDIITSFKKLGFNHLLIISGFHIGLLVLILNSIGMGLKVQTWLIDMSSILLIFGYIIITQGQASVVRAGLVVILYIIGRRYNRSVNVSNILSLVALIMLIINPYYLLQPGFQLSFVIVYSIIYLTPVLSHHLSFLPNILTNIISASIAAQLGAFPLLIYYFNQASLVPILGNILIMPLVSLILFFGFISLLLGSLHLIFAQLLNNISLLLSILLLKIMDFLKLFAFFKVKLPSPSYLLIGVYYFLLYQFEEAFSFKVIPYLNRKKERLIISLAVILLVCLGFSLSINFNDNLEANFIDVGQGDAAFLRLPTGDKVLVDGGEDKDKLADFLYKNGILNLEYIIITHFHKDHIQGLLRVLKEFNVKQVFIPTPIRRNKLIQKVFRIFKENEINYRIVKRDSTLQLQETVLNFYHYPRSINNPNNNSLVVRVDYDDFELLFTGDIEREVEEYLTYNGFELNSEVLKVAHHGSNTSSSNNFLDSVNPSTAIISVGRWNDYNLPNHQVINRLQTLGAKVFETKKVGAVIIKSNGQEYWIEDW
ncbi:DNA internalization-related competence protein ComEC/Rec2 [Selenihalanaerobacter shriftii]|uniref:Competence protein ComEC n=1 Tax=Selenihalanaerobacter shriftii TaxID=142842 RepID=A0A1T4PPP8_9FIRM|nr:DNA internalization-related competence protein ComEC/Rec2 [Selenihalanaerobacter shriftii]SJZ93530.1 competence protein ComEC [Selenihalanaerobacter shriftii]